LQREHELVLPFVREMQGVPRIAVTRWPKHARIQKT
jgi:hypothetical protein